MISTASPTMWGGFRAALRREMPGSDETRIRKLEVSKDGALLAQLRDGPQPLWLQWNGQQMTALKPEADDGIPLAALLLERKADPSLQTLNYRPGRRLVLLDRRRGRPVVIKGFRSGRAAAAFARYKAAHTALSGCGMHAPEVMDLDEKRESLTLLYEPGVPLDLSRGSMDTLHRIGQYLADFQGRDAGPEIHRFGSRDELEVIDRFVLKLAVMGLDLPPNWGALRERLGAAEATLPPMSAGLCHRDLYDKQLICRPDSITLLDFDLMCRADVALDPANFLAHMVLREFQDLRGATAKSIDHCGTRFLEGLGRNAEPGFWQRLRFYQASSFCRLALVYALRPRWARLAPDMARMGGRCLDDLKRLQSF